MKNAARRSLAALLLVLAGCSAPVVPAAEAPLTEKVIALIAEEHLGKPFTASSASVHEEHEPDAVGAAVHYRAIATSRLWSAAITYGPSMRMIEGRCEPLSTEAPQPTCFWQDGVRIAWFTDTGQLFLTSPRQGEFVNVAVDNLTRQADPRNGTGQVALDRLVGLAADPRLDATTDATLAAAAEASPRWTDDPGCERATATGPIPLPAVPSPATEPTSPQAVSAVVASHVAGTCAADWNPVDPGPVGGMVYLTAGREWVAAYLSTDPRFSRCYWGECTQKGGVITSYLRSSDETYPTHVRMVRRIEGGYLVVEEAALGVDWEDRPFPVPLTVMRDILFDQRLAFTADPALNEAGLELAMCWRLFDYAGE